MKLAFVTHQGRIASLYPGAHLLIATVKNANYECRILETDSWPQLSWGKQLMVNDVNVLLCGGIEQFYYGMIQGYGIKVIPDAAGAVLDVLDGWISGKLQIPQLWPYCPNEGAAGHGRCCKMRRRAGL